MEVTSPAADQEGDLFSLNTNDEAHNYYVAAVWLLGLMLLFILLGVGYYFCYYLRKYNAARRNPQDSINMVPVSSYQFDEATNEQNRAICSLCRAEFEDRQQIRTLPCAHFFHIRCVDAWLTFHRKCPVCRIRVLPNRQQVLHLGP